MALISRGLKCVRYSTYAFNAILWIDGAALLGLGIWFMLENKWLLEQVPPIVVENVSEPLIYSIGISAVIIGGVVLLASFLGCCGVVKNNRHILAAFAGTMLQIFVATTVIGVLSFNFRNTMKSFTAFKQIMELELQHEEQNGLLYFSHKQWRCCGILSETACNRTFPPVEVCTVGSSKCSNGCLEALWINALKPLVVVVGSAFLATSAVLVIGIALSLALRRKIYMSITASDNGKSRRPT